MTRYNECKTKLPNNHLCGKPTYGAQYCLDHTLRNCPRRKVPVSYARCREMLGDGGCPGECVEVRKRPA